MSSAPNEKSSYGAEGNRRKTPALEIRGISACPLACLFKIKERGRQILKYYNIINIMQIKL